MKPHDQVGKRSSSRAARSQSKTAAGVKPHWKKLLGAELYARAEFVRERDGTEIDEMVIEAIQSCTAAEALALAKEPNKGLRALMADWLATPIDEEPESKPKLPLPSPAGAPPALNDEERAALVKLVAQHDESHRFYDLKGAVDQAVFVIDLYGRSYENLATIVNNEELANNLKAASTSQRHDACLSLSREFNELIERMNHLRSTVLALWALAGLPLSEAQSGSLKAMLKEHVLLGRVEREAVPSAEGPKVAA
jgi:hypothetical protein